MENRGHAVGIALTVAVAMLLLPSTAHAYLGPGGVITAIGAMLALLVAILASIAGFLWYPLKRLLVWLRGRRSSRDMATTTSSADSTTG